MAGTTVTIHASPAIRVGIGLAMQSMTSFTTMVGTTPASFLPSQARCHPHQGLPGPIKCWVLALPLVGTTPAMLGLHKPCGGVVYGVPQCMFSIQAMPLAISRYLHP
mmetsp:Transcript_74841/g.132180  ORF Transcript_74841/g.132180 Transcript_74841/m.132180 type:complete len:107 (-) Transcript_74841:293-613(-)